MVGTPHNGYFPWQYLLSMNLTWKLLGNKYDIGVALTESCYVHANRNNIMKEVSKQNCDYLLFIDSDMAWNPDDVERLVEHDLDVVSGLYYTRRPYDGNTPAPVVYRLQHDQTKLKPIYIIPDRPFKCDAVGAGFLLLKKRVVDKVMELIPQIGYPFDFIDHEEMGLLPKENTRFVGEDISFCHRLKKANFDIWCDPAVRVGHIRTEILCPITQ